MNRIPNPLYLAGVLALALLLMASAPVLAQDVSGTILSIEPDDHTFDLVTDDGNVLNFRAVVTAGVFINDEASDMWGLQAGDQVSVTYDLEDDVLVATLIRCSRGD